MSRKPRPLADRFFDLFEPEPMTGCWLWTAFVERGGYGRMKVNGRPRSAHAAALIVHGVEIPKGMVVDHKCRQRSCVNPDHLRVVTPRTNVFENSEAITKRLSERTHCSRGHELGGANTGWMPKGAKYRPCRACKRDKNRLFMRGFYKKRKAARAVEFGEACVSVVG